MRLLIIFTIALVSWAPAYAEPDIFTHFLGSKPACVSSNEPTLVVTDVTRSGEIDDTISLAMYRRLELLDCIKVLGVVSIFGNGGSSTNQVHKNLLVRLDELGIHDWQILHGPDNPMSYEFDGRPSVHDLHHLQKIANAITASPSPVTIVELGPMSASGSLLRYGLVDPKQIERIIGVGGRSPGEHFKTGRGFPLFSFRDMNIAEDRASAAWLLHYHPNKLSMVTYKTGIGNRALSSTMIENFTVPSIAEHSQKRIRAMTFLGYSGIPSWDTWTTSFFVQGGAERLGCRPTPAQMRHSDGYKATDSMQLQLLPSHNRHSRVITACHEVGN